MNANPNQENSDYERDRELARHEDPKVRIALAARQDVRPEILYFLAEDPSAEVRRTLAANAAAPRQADLALASDKDEDVRAGLVEKIAKMAPELSPDEQDKIRLATFETLDVLARDQVTRVRQILSETLKDVAGAPADLINRLARDSEAVVASPVLEFSPVLTDEDLLEIIEIGPAMGGLSAISRRSQINESVADAIADTDDVEAIAELLSNPSAQLREETLDDLVERASSIELWHAPLVGRPKLPARCATRMAHFIADNLLGTLQEREDLDAETLEAVKSIVSHRIDEGKGKEKGADTAILGLDFKQVESLLDMAQRLHDSGKLDKKMIGKSLQASDYDFAVAALTARSKLPVKVVEKIFTSRSAKGIVALSWKAELPMKLAFFLQQRVARIVPGEVISPKNKNDYPMNEDEMNWQLQFFSDLSEKRGR